ncbi:hypothetical protein KPH14_006534 [Odynerus spinipes]|uniref:Uncharacterized protein n=1 Tax=Odynerus spinipes TaxID=1348599 RepID=A0AAD9RRP1_9HYME|nr:hypothetical protein KPH14_006534 [Odynerus spinipes]
MRIIHGLCRPKILLSRVYGLRENSKKSESRVYTLEGVANAKLYLHLNGNKKHVTPKRNVTKRTNAVTNNGLTALDIAQKLDYISVIETLKTVTELSLPRHIRSLSKRNTDYGETSKLLLPMMNDVDDIQIHPWKYQTAVRNLQMIM